MAKMNERSSYGFHALTVLQDTMRGRSHEGARSVPKDAGRNGRYETVLGFVAAARIFGRAARLPIKNGKALRILGCRVYANAFDCLHLL
jgi:hypothetical protein